MSEKLYFEHKEGQRHIRSSVSGESIMCDEHYYPWVPDDSEYWHLFAAAPELFAALEELYAVVKGECPSLLNEDSGGDAELSLEIESVLTKARGEISR